MPAVGLMGHATCLTHLPCLCDKWKFDPFRCSHCILYINEHFVNPNSLDEVMRPRDELERLLRRLRTAAKKDNYSKLSYPPLVHTLKSKLTKLEDYKDLVPLELAFKASEDVSSVMSSVSKASGSRASSSKSSPSKRSGSKSSRSKVSGSRASGSRASSVTSKKLDFLISHVTEIRAEQRSQAERLTALESPRADPVPGPSRPPLPEDPVVVVHPVGPPAVVTSSMIPVTNVASVVFTSAGVTSSLPPSVSVTSPIPVVPDPSSLSSAISLPSPRQPVYSPISSSSIPGLASPPSRPAPPAFPSMPPPRMPAPFPSSSSKGGRAFVPGLRSAFSDLVRASGLVQGGGDSSLSLVAPGVAGVPVVQGGSGSVQEGFSLQGQGFEFVQGGGACVSGDSEIISEMVSVRMVVNDGQEGFIPPGNVSVVSEAGVVSGSAVSFVPAATSASGVSAATVSGLGSGALSGTSQSSLLDSDLVSSGLSGEARGLAGRKLTGRAGPSVSSSSLVAGPSGRNSLGTGDGRSHPVGEPRNSSVPVSSFRREGSRGFSFHRGRDVSPNRDNEDLEKDDEEMDWSDISVGSLEEKWSPWRVLEEPFVLLKDGDIIVSLFNRSSRELVPWESVKVKKEDGVTLFSTRREKPKFVVCPRKEISDRKRMMSFCAQFPHYCQEVDESFCEFWPKGFRYVSEFLDDSLKSHDFPLSPDAMRRTFESVGTHSTLAPFPLKVPLIMYLSSYAELVSCLPVKQFASDFVAADFGQQAKDLVSLPAELALEEHNSRLQLLALTVALSAVQGFSVLSQNSVNPSALEASGSSLLSGIFPFLSYGWYQPYLRFCKARTALRKSVFVKPLHQLATQLVISDPFSKSLFSKDAILQASYKFHHHNVEWKDLLIFKKKDTGHNRQRPRAARRPFLRPYAQRRGAQGRFQGNWGGQERNRAATNRGYRNRRFQQRGAKGRGKN